MDRKFRVGISGSYGGLNLGDEAILQCMIRELRQSVSVDITVFTRDPEDTMRRHLVERAVPVRNAVVTQAVQTELLRQGADLRGLPIEKSAQ